VLVGKLNDSLDVLMRSGVDYHIDTSWEGAMPQSVDFCQSGAVRVLYTLPFKERASIVASLGQLFKEGMIELRRVNLHISLLGGRLVEVYASIILCPAFQVRKLLVADFISVA
jgi:hypothetical protein